ncbi:MAG: CocE/NonD family hydrolase [Mycolicibacterium sp.]|uniref:S15 peptidase family protein n=1 Tax=Mycolicibacterium sp. TaxID=2320850 RepID=UPI003D14A1B9
MTSSKSQSPSDDVDKADVVDDEADDADALGADLDTDHGGGEQYGLDIDGGDDGAVEASISSLATSDGSTRESEAQSEASAWLASPEAAAGRASAETGGEPVGPSGPQELVMAAAVRRQSLTSIFGNPITVDPVLGFTDGVLQGDLNATPDPVTLNYVVTKQPDQGGKVTFNELTDPVTKATYENGTFSYLPDLSVLDSGGSEQFTVMVSEYSSLVKLLAQVPLLGALVEPIVLRLQQVPLIGGLLQPLIGYRVFTPIDVNVGELVPEGAPVAFTTFVTSFDGVQISTNFFPATGLTAGEKAPTVLNGPGLGMAGNTDPTSELVAPMNLVPGIKPLRDAGYNFVSWDSRGTYISGGVMQLDNPFFEGRDVQHIIDWVATRPETKLDAPGDPSMGMVGGSYGGGIQLVSAGIDNRIEAIVPAAAWNSLVEALYPTADFKTSWALLLMVLLQPAHARINSQVPSAILLGSTFGFITESQQATIASSGPTVLVDNITAPTLLIQGTVDDLFTLEQSTINAGILDSNGVPVNVIWACGGHGVCLNPQNPDQPRLLVESTLNWLDKYVKGNEAAQTGPRFRWYDQNGDLHASELLPSDPAFYGEPLARLAGGGLLLLNPIVGGSGPQTQPPTPLIVAPGLAAPAAIAIDIDVSGPVITREIVGAPELTITYSGLGTSRHVYAQLVDDETGLVLGNVVTPVPVDLDGRTHTVTIPMEQIAYTMEPTDRLTLQLAGATSVYADLTQWGFIDVETVEIRLPTVAFLEDDAVDRELERLFATS